MHRLLATILEILFQFQKAQNLALESHVIREMQEDKDQCSFLVKINKNGNGGQQVSQASQAGIFLVQNVQWVNFTPFVMFMNGDDHQAGHLNGGSLKGICVSLMRVIPHKKGKQMPIYAASAYTNPSPLCYWAIYRFIVSPRLVCVCAKVKTANI